MKKGYAQFACFDSVVSLAHSYWKQILLPGDWAIDATCGNGKDALVLATLPFMQSHDSGMIAIDIQQTAIEKTSLLLRHALSNEQWMRIHVYCQSHTIFPPLATQKRIKLIAYNLGYLPGSDKRCKTLATSTILSYTQALPLLCPGGVISIVSYPGHPEGAQEQLELLESVKKLDPKHFSVSYHSLMNRHLAPSLFLIQKSNIHS